MRKRVSNSRTFSTSVLEGLALNVSCNMLLPLREELGSGPQNTHEEKSSSTCCVIVSVVLVQYALMLWCCLSAQHSLLSQHTSLAMTSEHLEAVYPSPARQTTTSHPGHHTGPPAVNSLLTFNISSNCLLSSPVGYTLCRARTDYRKLIIEITQNASEGRGR